MKTCLAALAATTMLIGAASAQTYTSDPFNGIAQGGNYYQPTTANAYGQFFSSPTNGTLSSITFVDTDATSSGTQLVIQAFNTSTLMAIGPVLYQGFGSVTGDGSDFLYYHSFTGIGTSVVAGLSYVAYLADAPGQDTFNGVPIYDPEDPEDGPIDSTTFFYGIGRYKSALGGAFVYRDPSAASGQAFVTTVDATPGHDPLFQADYTITINPAVAGAVPEPMTWAMMMIGLAMVGGTMRYRRRKTSVVYA